MTERKLHTKGLEHNALEIQGLTKIFRQKNRDPVVALNDVSLRLAPGEFLVLLGPSGCGKTTLLRCIAGLEHPDAGVLRLGDKVLFSSENSIYLPPEDRGLGMVFQSYALWPHMSTFENVAYPLRTRGMARAAIENVVGETLSLLEIEHLRDRYPANMSGGQQQRVSLARALVVNNGVVLFDEPLSNVDAKVRANLRVELVRMQQEVGFSAVYVTHDQVEAMQMADRLAVVHLGELQQLGTPAEIYRHPATAFVGDFIGASNQVEGIVASEEVDSVSVETDLGTMYAATNGHRVAEGCRVSLMFRPESIAIEMDDYVPADSRNRWSGYVEAVLFSGAYSEFVVDIGGEQVLVWAVGNDDITEGSKVAINVPPHRIQVFDHRSQSVDANSS